jgi:hypothetical protein
MEGVSPKLRRRRPPLPPWLVPDFRVPCEPPNKGHALSVRVCCSRYVQRNAWPGVHVPPARTCLIVGTTTPWFAGGAKSPHSRPNPTKMHGFPESLLGGGSS